MDFLALMLYGISQINTQEVNAVFYGKGLRNEVHMLTWGMIKHAEYQTALSRRKRLEQYYCVRGYNRST